jgi:hypothetical protein
MPSGGSGRPYCGPSSNAVQVDDGTNYDSLKVRVDICFAIDTLHCILLYIIIYGPPSNAMVNVRVNAEERRATLRPRSMKRQCRRAAAVDRIAGRPAMQCKSTTGLTMTLFSWNFERLYYGTLFYIASHG